MELPSQRELQLETLLRERETQIAELNDELKLLRRYLISQPAPSRTDPVALPPALLSILQQHLDTKQSAGTQGTSSSTMTAALMQRTHVLQEENNELYELLRISETGKLKEEVHSLKRAVTRSERALKESHGTISSLTDELDKSYTSFLSQQKVSDTYQRDSGSPATARTVPGDSSNASANGDVKPIPTGPRAHKKPRLSEPPSGPIGEKRPPPAPTSMSHSNATPLGPSNARGGRREREPDERSGSRMRTPMKEPRMEGDEDVKMSSGRVGSRDRDRGHRSRERSREREGSRRNRDRPRERERQRRKERDRERPRDLRDSERHKDEGSEKEPDRDRDRERSRRNGRHGGRGSGGGGGGGGARKSERASNAQDGDRSLRERMGL